MVTRNQPHVIRLHAAWELDKLNRQYSRRFNTPTGLSAKVVVWLVADSLEGVETLLLNETPLPLDEEPRWEITQLLNRRGSNRLDLSALADSEPRLLQTVRLEIHESD